MDENRTGGTGGGGRGRPLRLHDLAVAAAVAVVALLAAGCGSRVHGGDRAASDPTLGGPAVTAVTAARNEPLVEPVDRVEPVEVPDVRPDAREAAVAPVDAGGAAPPDPAPVVEPPATSGGVRETSPSPLPPPRSTPAAPFGDGAPAGSPADPGDRPPGDADGAVALRAAIDRADGSTYHASFTGQVTGPDGRTTATSIEIWNRPGASARVVTVSMGGSRLTTRDYRTPTGRLVCVGASPSARCTPVPGSGVVDGAAIASAVDASAGAVTTMVGSVDGIPATCFHVGDAAAARAEACFDAAGVPLVIADGNVRVTRTAVDADVTDADVAPPTG